MVYIITKYKYFFLTIEYFYDNDKKCYYIYLNPFLTIIQSYIIIINIVDYVLVVYIFFILYFIISKAIYN